MLHHVTSTELVTVTLLLIHKSYNIHDISDHTYIMISKENTGNTGNILTLPIATHLQCKT